MSTGTTQYFQARQGDLFIERIGDRTSGAHDIRTYANFKNVRKSKSRILAYGEESGHKHELTGGTVYVPASLDDPILQWVVLDEPATLVHDVHAPIALEPGTYKVTRQRELSDDSAHYFAID